MHQSQSLCVRIRSVASKGNLKNYFAWFGISVAKNKFGLKKSPFDYNNSPKLRKKNRLTKGTDNVILNLLHIYYMAHFLNS